MSMMEDRDKHAEAFAQKIAQELDVKRMLEDLQSFNKLERYTGSPDGEKAVDLITERMRSLGIPVAREYYDIYRSLPLEASVEIVEGAFAPKKYCATPYVYSGCAQNLQAPVIFDSYSEGGNCPQVLMEKRFAAFKDKIVLTYDNTYNFACRARQAGALGILNIWVADIAHHGTLGGVWGTPEPDDLQYRYPYIPYVELVKSDGEELKSLLRQGNGVIVSLNVSMDTSIKKSSMPIATIKGKSDKFVLVSGHYDSWYEGITDNAVANVSMMELARVLQEHRSELDRTVVLAWWSGHSDGRYSGSTWYFDHHWHELKNNCVAHVNMDICGCKGSDLVGFNTSMLEGAAFAENFLKEFNKETPIPPEPMARFADQTFWGAHVPLAIMPKFSRKVLPGERTFYWWHTKQDTIDKIDPAIVLRDSRVIAKLACIFANTKRLPVDLAGFVEMMDKRLHAIEEQLSPDFEMSDLFPYMDRLKNVIEKLNLALKNQEDTDGIITAVAGELVRITYTSSSPYHQDLAVESLQFPKLSCAMGQTPENTQPDYYLALKTLFTRQKNRLIGQICEVIEKCENQLFRWKTAERERKV